jgi:hypothetical protein
MKSFLFLGALAACTLSATAGAALIPAEPTLFLRSNTVSGNSTSFAQYTSLSNLVSGTTSLPTIDFVDHQANDIFWDGSVWYRTWQTGGAKTKVYSWTSLDDYGDNTKATITNLSNNWSANDDFWCDQDGNFYRTSTVNSASDGVTKYTSFANLVSNTGGVFTNFTTNFGLGDRFWSYGSKFYKTTTSGSSTSTIKVYDSLAALAANTPSATYNASGYSTGDAFVFIPAPGALALLGLAGLAPRSRRRG